MDCWREILVVFIFTLIGVWACAARAQQVPCVDKEKGKRNLMKAGEMPAFYGLSLRGHVTQIWINSKTGVWTATYILPSGHLCIADSGTHATLLKPTKEATYGFNSRKD